MVCYAEYSGSLLTDVSGQHIDPIFNGQAVQEDILSHVGM